MSKGGILKLEGRTYNKEQTIFCKDLILYSEIKHSVTTLQMKDFRLRALFNNYCHLVTLTP